MGKYDHVLLCNGAQYRASATWIQQIRAIGGHVVPQSVTDRVKVKMDGYAARLARWIGGWAQPSQGGTRRGAYGVIPQAGKR